MSLPPGWRNAELIWEEIQEAAAECALGGDWTEAAELWQGALEVAREYLASDDARLATSLVNVAVSRRQAGDETGAAGLLDEALTVWQAAGPWLAALQPETRARSSTFHLRLARRHAEVYAQHARAAWQAWADAGLARITAHRAGAVWQVTLADWQAARSAGYNDKRKLLSAVYLMITAELPAA